MDRKEALARYKEADALHRQHRYAEALAILEELEGVLPPKRSLLYAHALCLTRLQRNEEAIEVCHRINALFDDPRADKLLAHLGATSAPSVRAASDSITQVSLHAPAEDVAERPQPEDAQIQGPEPALSPGATVGTGEHDEPPAHEEPRQAAAEPARGPIDVPPPEQDEAPVPEPLRSPETMVGDREQVTDEPQGHEAPLQELPEPGEDRVDVPSPTQEEAPDREPPQAPDAAAEVWEYIPEEPQALAEPRLGITELGEERLDAPLSEQDEGPASEQPESTGAAVSISEEVSGAPQAAEEPHQEAARDDSVPAPPLDDEEEPTPDTPEEKPQADVVQPDMPEPPPSETPEPASEEGADAATAEEQTALPATDGARQSDTFRVGIRTVGLVAAGLLLIALLAIGASILFGGRGREPLDATELRESRPVMGIPPLPAPGPSSETPQMQDIARDTAPEAPSASEPADARQDASLEERMTDGIRRTDLGGRDSSLEETPESSTPVTPESLVSQGGSTSPRKGLAAGATWRMAGEVRVQSSVVMAPDASPMTEESRFFVRIETTVTGNDGETLRLTHRVREYPAVAQFWSATDFAEQEPTSQETIHQTFSLTSEHRGLAAHESASLRPMVSEFCFPLLTPEDPRPDQTLLVDSPMRNPMTSGGFDWPGVLTLMVKDVDEESLRVVYAHTVPFQKLEVPTGQISFEAHHSGESMLDRETRQETYRKGSQSIRVTTPSQTSREERIEFALTQQVL